MFERNIIIRKHLIENNVEFRRYENCIFVIRINLNTKTIGIWIIKRINSNFEKCIWWFNCRSNIQIFIEKN